MARSVICFRMLSGTTPPTPHPTPALNLDGSHCYKLFVVAKKVNSFAIKQIQTLSQKHPGWGIPAPSAFPTSDFPMFRTLLCPPFVFITLRIPSPTTPLFSHPYKTLGVVGYFPFGCSRVTGHESQVTPFHLLADSLFLLPLFFAVAPFLFNGLRTLLQNTRGWGYPPAITGQPEAYLECMNIRAIGRPVRRSDLQMPFWTPFVSPSLRRNVDAARTSNYHCRRVRFRKPRVQVYG